MLVLATFGLLIAWKKSDVVEMQKLLTISDVGEGNIPDHYIGKKDAKVIAIEYGDFACVHCAQWAPTFKKIATDYQDRILFIYRHFSLGYPNSASTQSAAEAAYLLGGEEAYWKMHHLLFRDDLTWTGQAVSKEKQDDILGGFATEIGLDVDEFLKIVDETVKIIEDHKNNNISDKIDRDKKLGREVKVSGTPVWLVDGKKVEISKKIEITDSNIRKAIDEALAATDEKTN